MKVIISRKGFDSGYGGMPSPILPDGTMISMPIPSPATRLGMMICHMTESPMLI